MNVWHGGWKREEWMPTDTYVRGTLAKNINTFWHMNGNKLEPSGWKCVGHLDFISNKCKLIILIIKYSMETLHPI
jgi:hypothetical protein